MGASAPARFDEDAEREQSALALEQARKEVASLAAPIGKGGSRLRRRRSPVGDRALGGHAGCHRKSRRRLYARHRRRFDDDGARAPDATALRALGRQAHGASLLVIGRHRPVPGPDVVLGATDRGLVESAPCSVLVARPAGDDFPRQIVVGVDGSTESARAYAVAAALAERFGALLWPVVASGGNGVDKLRVAAIVEHYEELADDPVDAHVADGDLVVVGSRGLHGVKALGSVSERVAQRAGCSTLIGRGSAHAVVVRDGVAVELNAEDVVVGDVIVLSAGVAVPPRAASDDVARLRTGSRRRGSRRGAAPDRRGGEGGASASPARAEPTGGIATDAQGRPR